MHDETAHPVTQILYTSTAVEPFTQPQLKQLLARARAHNEPLGISGMLVYDDGFFVQVLEGPEEAVQPLFAAIERDPRHTNMRLLLRHTLAEKEFEN